MVADWQLRDMFDSPVSSNCVKGGLDVVFLPLEHLPNFNDDVGEVLSGTPEVGNTHILSEVWMKNGAVCDCARLLPRVASGQIHVDDGCVVNDGLVGGIEPERGDLVSDAISFRRNRAKCLSQDHGVPVKASSNLFVIMLQSPQPGAHHG